MDVRNCKVCDRLFNYISGVPLCSVCKEAAESKFSEVKEYIYENPGASMKQVADETDVSIKQIKQWIREERLVLSEPSADGITCERCGIPICSGRYCEKCKGQMSNTFNSVIDRPKRAVLQQEKKYSKDGNKMRFLS